MITQFDFYLQEGDVGVQTKTTYCYPHQFQEVNSISQITKPGICKTSTGIIPVFSDNGGLQSVSVPKDSTGGYLLLNMTLIDGDEDNLANNQMSKTRSSIQRISGTHFFDYSDSGLNYWGTFDIKFLNLATYAEETISRSINIKLGSQTGLTFKRSHNTVFRTNIIPDTPNYATARFRNEPELPLFIDGTRCVYMQPSINRDSADRPYLKLLIFVTNEGDGMVSATEPSNDGTYTPFSMASNISSNPISDGIVTALTESKEFANSIASTVTKNFIAR